MRRCASVVCRALVVWFILVIPTTSAVVEQIPCALPRGNDVPPGLSTLTFQQRRELVTLLIDRVIVDDEKVEIRYVIPTSPAGEEKLFCHLRKDYRVSVQRLQVQWLELGTGTGEKSGASGAFADWHGTGHLGDYPCRRSGC